MCKKIFAIVCLCCSAIFVSACDQRNGIGATSKPSGTLYWIFSGNAGAYELSSGNYSEKMMKMASFDAFDISWDNQKILLSMDVKGSFNFDQRRMVVRPNASGITYSDVENGDNIRDIKVEWGNISKTHGHISPNERYIAVEAQLMSDLPITIVNASNGEMISQWKNDDVKLTHYGAPIWTADNTLYFRIGNIVYRCGPHDNYDSAEKVLNLPEDSSFMTINPQGTKLVFRHNRHLWMSDLDGSNMRQITHSKTSDSIDYDGERMPTFSPDGKYIAFTSATTNGAAWSDHGHPDGSWVAVTGGRFGYITIIPADGKLRDIDDTGSGAIWLQNPNAEGAGIPASAHLIWR